MVDIIINMKDKQEKSNHSRNDQCLTFRLVYHGLDKVANTCLKNRYTKKAFPKMGRLI